MSPTETRELAHRLIDRMSPAQLTAVVRVLEIVADPVVHSLANAPIVPRHTQHPARGHQWKHECAEEEENGHFRGKTIRLSTEI